MTRPSEPTPQWNRPAFGHGKGVGDSPGGSTRAAEVIAALSLATDLGTGLPLEHGLESTLFAMRLCERMGVDADTASDTYYACLLFYVGCTADAEIVAELFPGEDAIVEHVTPVMFGDRGELLAGLLRALATGSGPPILRGLRAVRMLPRAARAQRDHLRALCEVARMLTRRLGLTPSVQALFDEFTERWDGLGGPRGTAGEEIPLPVRITHVARDIAFHRLVEGSDSAIRKVRARSGAAFDPRVVRCLSEDPAAILTLDAAEPAWDRVLACEPEPHLVLEGNRLDRALRAMGDFADLISPWLVGHSSGVAALAAKAARLLGFDTGEVRAVWRAAAIHDLGRVAVPAAIWAKPGRFSADEWERVRLHPYHTERLLSRSPSLAPIAALAGTHHERMDGSGYHRAVKAVSLPTAARVLAAADAFHAMTEPRPHREALPTTEATDTLGREASAGRLDPDATAAVLQAAGEPVPSIDRPAGLTERESEVIRLVARGLQTKQVAHRLGISAKTADRHIQSSYRKIGISSRAAAALFAMEHGLARWGEFPIVRSGHHL